MTTTYYMVSRPSLSTCARALKTPRPPWRIVGSLWLNELCLATGTERDLRSTCRRKPRSCMWAAAGRSAPLRNATVTLLRKIHAGGASYLALITPKMPLT
jgi:hypothetical protein